MNAWAMTLRSGLPAFAHHRTPFILTRNITETETFRHNQILMSAANQSSPNWADLNPSLNPNPNPNSAGASTAFLQTLNPAIRTQLQPHVGLGGGGGAPAPGAHVLGETPHQHGYSNHHHLGQQLLQRPLDTVAQTTSLEQPGFTQGNPGPIASGSGTGTGGVAGPATPGGTTDERTHYQWTGTLQWQNDMKITRTEVTATATKGNPCALSPHRTFLLIEKTNIHWPRLAWTWPKVLLLSPAKPMVSMDEFQDWIRRTNPVVMQIRPASMTDDPSYGQLVQLLRTKGSVRRKL